MTHNFSSRNYHCMQSSGVSLGVFVSVAGFWTHMTFIRPPGSADHLPHSANCVMRNMVLIPFSYSLHQTLSLAKYFAEASSAQPWCNCVVSVLFILLMLSFFPSCLLQTLSRWLCRSASAASQSQRGTSPSTTAPLWSSCPAACRELASTSPPN